jgi:hypothetical protein
MDTKTQRILSSFALCVLTYIEIAHPVVNTSAAIQAAPSNAADAGPKLNGRIPRADPKQYEAVLDWRDWRNPWLDAVQNGFWLHSRSTPQKKFVTLADLRRVLTQLPVSDWPYGRVVVIQSPSIIGSVEEWRVVDANVDAARKIAKALDADSWGWPS